MITLDVSITENITKDIKRIQKELKLVPQEALQEFVALTPVKTGNARSRTGLSGTTIVANYPYAQRLDEGWSKQAPRGMTLPLEQWLKKRVDGIFGR